MQDVADAKSDPTSSPPITVVVTVLDEREAVGPLVEALLAQLRGRDELMIVDGGSTDGTAEVIAAIAGREQGRVTFLQRPGTNISEGRNAGVRQARNDVIACTDAGCLPAAGWLDAFRAAFGAAPSPDLVTGVYEVAAQGPFEHAMSAACYPQIDENPSGNGAIALYGRLFGRTFDPTLPTGRSMAFTRKAWELVGGFPEHLATSEDISFGRAISAAGMRCVLAPGASVRWSQRPDAASTARMYYRYGVGGGRTGDPKLIGRDLLRAVVYPAGIVLAVWAGWGGRAVVGAGAGAYLSVPVWRALRRPNQPFTTAFVPLAVALKDVSKAAGCLAGLLGKRN